MQSVASFWEAIPSCIALRCSIRGAEIQAHANYYYNIEMFRASYAGSVPSMADSLDKTLGLQSTRTNSKKASRQTQEAEN